MSDTLKTIEQMAKDLGDQLFQNNKKRLEDLKIELVLGDLEILERASHRFSLLSLMALQGVDVKIKIAECEAIMANLSYVKAAKVKKAFWDSVEEVIGGTFRLLLSIIAKGLLGVSLK